jgi:hypothetical protein
MERKVGLGLLPTSNNGSFQPPGEPNPMLGSIHVNSDGYGKKERYRQVP